MTEWIIVLSGESETLICNKKLYIIFDNFTQRLNIYFKNSHHHTSFKVKPLEIQSFDIIPKIKTQIVLLSWICHLYLL